MESSENSAEKLAEEFGARPMITAAKSLRRAVIPATAFREWGGLSTRILDALNANKRPKRNVEPSEIGPDDPITLKDACRIAFHDKIKVASLRAEAERGHLETFRIGKRDFTTLRNIKAMIERNQRCPPARKVPGFTSTKNDGNGLSDTANVSSARGALRETAKVLKKRCTNISPTVVNLKHRRPR
jgi:hypothetical protein